MDHSIEYRETGPWRCPRPTELSVLIEDLERVLAPLKTLGVCTPSESPFHSPSVRENFEKKWCKRCADATRSEKPQNPYRTEYLISLSAVLAIKRSIKKRKYVT